VTEQQLRGALKYNNDNDWNDRHYWNECGEQILRLLTPQATVLLKGRIKADRLCECQHPVELAYWK